MAAVRFKTRSRSRSRSKASSPSGSPTPGKRRSSSTSKSDVSAPSGELFEQSQMKKYRLKVTAGTEYDPTTHQSVPVNGDQTVVIDNELATVSLSVRIQDYSGIHFIFLATYTHGYPDSAPQTHSFFDDPSHNTDQYSITFSIIFKIPVNGNDLLFGNDFDRPIRNRLPPGFNTAFRVVKWSIDQSMDGDVYADKPYLFSPALASWNQLKIGEKIRRGDDVPRVNGVVVEEGAEGDDGKKVREEVYGIPGEGNARMKHFHNEEERKRFEFEAGRKYWVNFGNPYLVFNDFSLRLPGFTLSAIKYVDEKNHDLRYVLKNRHTNQVYFVVLFSLLLVGVADEPGQREQIEKDTQTFKEKGEQLGKFEMDVD